jgi:hypothetical protein
MGYAYSIIKDPQNSALAMSNAERRMSNLMQQGHDDHRGSTTTACVPIIIGAIAVAHYDVNR